MKYVYFKINCLFPQDGTEQLNACLAAYAVSSIKEYFVDDGQDSFWSARVAIVEPSTQSSLDPATPKKKGGVDYRDILSPDVFAIYAKLRVLRNTIAEQQSIPAYAIFTNEQLAEMAKLEQPDKTRIANIDGIGEKRLAMYVDQFLALLQNPDG